MTALTGAACQDIAKILARDKCIRKTDNCQLLIVGSVIGVLGSTPGI